MEQQYKIWNNNTKYGTATGNVNHMNIKYLATRNSSLLLVPFSHNHFLNIIIPICSFTTEVSKSVMDNSFWNVKGKRITKIRKENSQLMIIEQWVIAYQINKQTHHTSCKNTNRQWPLEPSPERPMAHRWGLLQIRTKSDIKKYYINASKYSHQVSIRLKHWVLHKL